VSLWLNFRKVASGNVLAGSTSQRRGRARPSGPGVVCTVHRIRRDTQLEGDRNSRKTPGILKNTDPDGRPVACGCPRRTNYGTTDWQVHAFRAKLRKRSEKGSGTNSLKARRVLRTIGSWSEKGSGTNGQMARRVLRTIGSQVRKGVRNQ
jgi:hypothetical protein